MDWASESTYVTPERNTFSLESNEQDVSNKPGIFSNGIISDESQSDGENEDDDYTKNNSLSDKNKSIKEKIVEDYKLKKLLSTRSLLAEKKRDKLQVAIAANGDSNGDDDETLASHEPSNLLDEEEEANKENQEKFELNIGHKRYEELDEDTITSCLVSIPWGRKNGV
ncbi:uncharacterized protein LOC107981244 isoform X2 [Nasonia vitripennis]|uniref:Uncharacterized protein n=1 Tax=Nasonia vitripennis TaxID=7425 RepID=A0A7M7PUC3_NASVI|nr:uncharacterized protein LOC107981244 isoform X2 [Nasonia vitripennis]